LGTGKSSAPFFSQHAIGVMLVRISGLGGPFIMKPLKVGTAWLLLFLMFTLCFAAGGYEIYRLWTEHRGPHGRMAPPLGLPEIGNTSQHKMKLGS
jgi:hypothetical protein